MAFDDVLYVIFGPNANNNKTGVKYAHGGICSYHALPVDCPSFLPAFPPSDDCDGFRVEKNDDALFFSCFGGSVFFVDTFLSVYFPEFIIQAENARILWKFPVKIRKRWNVIGIL